MQSDKLNDIPEDHWSCKNSSDLDSFTSRGTTVMTPALGVGVAGFI